MWLYFIVPIIYIGVFALYGVFAYTNYWDTLKSNTTLYFTIGLSIAILGNSLWLLLTKILPTNNSIYIGGIVYDSLVTLAFILIPWYFIGIKLANIQWIGLIIVIVGLLTLKLGG